MQRTVSYRLSEVVADVVQRLVPQREAAAGAAAPRPRRRRAAGRAGEPHGAPGRAQHVAPGAVQLTIGADFPVDDYLASDGTPIFVAPTSETPTAAPIDTVDATATGAQAPAPTDLTKMTGTDIPCVR